jgi:WD40 repeat protein
VTDGWDILLWDIRKFKLLLTLPGRNNQVESITFAPDGKTLVAVYQFPSRTVRLWDAVTGELRQELVEPKIGDEPGHWFRAAAFSPDGKKLAVSTSPVIEELPPGAPQLHEVRIWEPTGEGGAPWKRQVMKAPLTSEIWVNAVSFSPDGSTLAAGQVDGSVKLWNAETGTLKATLNPPQHLSLTEIAFSPDGKLLAVASHDNKAMIWDVAKGTLKYALSGTNDQIVTVAFSSDGKYLLGGDSNGAISRWSSHSGRLIATSMFLPSLQPDATADEADTFEWITYTPEGYYSGSPGVEEFFHWRLGEHIFPAAQYAKTYRRPDLVQQLLQSEQ